MTSIINKQFSYGHTHTLSFLPYSFRLYVFTFPQERRKSSKKRTNSPCTREGGRGGGAVLMAEFAVAHVAVTGLGINIFYFFSNVCLGNRSLRVCFVNITNGNLMSAKRQVDF